MEHLVGLYILIGLGLGFNHVEYRDEFGVWHYLANITAATIFWPLAIIMYVSLILSHVGRNGWLSLFRKRT